MSDKRVGDVNVVVVSGRIKDEPEVNKTRNGKQEVRIKLDVGNPGMNNGTFKVGVLVVAYGYTADEILKYGKGDHLLITGKLDLDVVEKDGRKFYNMRVTASDARSLTISIDEGSNGDERSERREEPPKREPKPSSDDDTDLPF